jgi:hypothetical protein
VAVVSTYAKLKAALDALPDDDDAHRCGFATTTPASTGRYDINNFPRPRPLTTPDPARVKEFHRRKVDFSALITEVVVNPKATPPLLDEVRPATCARIL